MPDETDARSDEALIAYIRGRLPEDEAARLAAEAAESPALAAEIALMRGIAAAVDADAAVATPGELGWARLSRAIDAEAARPAARVRRPLWPLAASAAAAVLVWQVVAVPLFTPGDQGPGYAPVSEEPSGDFSLSVAYAPTATEAEIRALLLEIGARVTGGPSAIGLWQLGFDSAAARDAGLARLQAADIVETAQPR